MALACLAAEYAKTRRSEIQTLHVDHGLRSESLQEAAQTARWCKALGFRHKTLTWTGPKPTSGVQAAARGARYSLLASHAQSLGLSSIVTAHNADDQAETVFMRLARGAGPKGLAAMDVETKIASGAGEPVRLLRPLLDAPRMRLAATAERFGQAYVSDPSNDDMQFERVRARALLAALGEQELLTRAALLRTASRARDWAKRAALEEERLFIRLGGCFFRWGGATLDSDAFFRLPIESVHGLMRRLIYAVGGSDFPPDADAAATAIAALRKSGAATLQGALLRTWRNELWILREPASVLGRAGASALPPTPLAAASPNLWDGRFILEARQASTDLEVRPLGRSGAQALGDRRGLFAGPEEGCLTLPAFYRNGVLIATVLDPIKTSGVAARTLCRERFAGEIVRFS